MWEDVRWLRQTTSVSTSASSTLQIRHKLLTAAGQLQVSCDVIGCSACALRSNSNGAILLPQSMLGTHNLGRVHYEPIKDRHGNVLFVTVRDTESHPSVFNGKWMQVSKLQSQRKSMSTPEEPYALDILIITIQVRKNTAPLLPDDLILTLTVNVAGLGGVPPTQYQTAHPGSLPGLPEAQQLCGPDQGPGLPADPQCALSQPHPGQRQRVQVPPHIRRRVFESVCKRLIRISARAWRVCSSEKSGIGSRSCQSQVKRAKR